MKCLPHVQRNGTSLGLIILLTTYALVHAGQASFEVSMIVRSANKFVKAASYCVSRYCPGDPMVPYSCPGNTWDQMPKSSGRISNAVADATDLTINLAYRIIATNNTMVFLKFFNSGTNEVGVAEGVLDVSSLTVAGLQQTWKVMSGLTEVGTALIEFYPGNVIASKGLQENTQYEPANPIAPENAVRVSDITGYAPMLVGVAPLPENLQGLWWLTHQKDSSAFLTFGGPGDDGAGCNNGLLSPTGEATIRVQGERSFSTAQAQWADTVLQAFDGVYKFKFNNASHPTYGQITSQSIHGVPYAGNILWLSNWSMILQGPDAEYPGSKVWLRKTNIMGFSAGHDYKLVQVIDGNRQKIQPAWNKFAAYMNSSVTGWTPGWMWYPSKYPSPSPGAPGYIAMVMRKVRSRLHLFILAMIFMVVCCIGCCAGLCYTHCRNKDDDGYDEYDDGYDEDGMQ